MPVLNLAVWFGHRYLLWMTLDAGNSRRECTSSPFIQVFGTSSGLRGKWRAAPRADELTTIGCSAPLGQTCILGDFGGIFFFFFTLFG
jgi:hypothetical protein